MSKLILSCAGGGVRGMATIRFLSMIESQLIAETGKGIYETFDMFAGTSIGGIIAIFLSVLKLKAAELEDYFNYEAVNEMMPQGFITDLRSFSRVMPKYTGVGKREIISRLFKKTLNTDENVLLDDAEKAVMVTAYNVEKRRAEILASYIKQKINAIDAADATSAAPIYYPSVETSIGVMQNKNSAFLVDGGVVCNKPTILSYIQGKYLWPEEEIKVLAIGTGRLVLPIDGVSTKSYGALQWLKHGFMDIIFDDTIVNQEALSLIGKNYISVNSDLPSYVSHKLDDVSKENLKGLKILGEEWYKVYGDIVVDFVKRK